MTTPAAAWMPDCQGKWDYDGPLLDISCRYWPSNYRSDGKISASAAILIRFGPVEVDPRRPRDLIDPPYLPVWREEFTGDTEAEVKVQVEEWVRAKTVFVAHSLLDLPAPLEEE